MTNIKNVATIVACAAATFACVGCGAAMRVKQGQTTLSGIPFYVKEARCVHQEVSVMPYARLTFQALEGGKITFSEMVTVSESYYLANATVGELVGMINGTADAHSMTTEDVERKIGTDWLAIKTDAGQNNVYAKEKDGTWPKYLIANSSMPKTFVDYGTVYYINEKVPFAGSAKADYKLGSDGTLTEASGEATEETLKTILGALPTADLIKSAAGIGLASKAVGGKALQLKVEHRVLKITKTQTVAFTAGCPEQEAFQSGPVGTLIEDVGADSPAETKSEGNSITVTGKIVLPKTAAPSSTSGEKQNTTANKDTAGAPPK